MDTTAIREEQYRMKYLTRAKEYLGSHSLEYWQEHGREYQSIDKTIQDVSNMVMLDRVNRAEDELMARDREFSELLARERDFVDRGLQTKKELMARLARYSREKDMRYFYGKR